MNQDLSEGILQPQSQSKKLVMLQNTVKSMPISESLDQNDTNLKGIFTNFQLKPMVVTPKSSSGENLSKQAKAMKSFNDKVNTERRDMTNDPGSAQLVKPNQPYAVVNRFSFDEPEEIQPVSMF